MSPARCCWHPASMPCGASSTLTPNNGSSARQGRPCWRLQLAGAWAFSWPRRISCRDWNTLTPARACRGAARAKRSVRLLAWQLCRRSFCRICTGLTGRAASASLKRFRSKARLRPTPALSRPFSWRPWRGAVGATGLSMSFGLLISVLSLSWCLNLPGFVSLLRLPGLNLMSHNRLVFLASFAILAMAAVGLEVLLQGPVTPRWWFWLPAAIARGVGRLVCLSGLLPARAN